jgi:hypothetical protein
MIAYPRVWLPIIIRVAEVAGIKNSARNKFTLEMVETIKTAHWMADNDPARLEYIKTTRELVDRLRQDIVVELLMGSDFRALRNLRERFHKEEQLIEHRPTKHRNKIIRKDFVFSVLDATDGSLGVNQRNGRGSLVEAVTLLQPHLPDLFGYGLGEETLRKLKRAWGKNRQK